MGARGRMACFPEAIFRCGGEEGMFVSDRGRRRSCDVEVVEEERFLVSDTGRRRSCDVEVVEEGRLLVSDRGRRRSCDVEVVEEGMFLFSDRWRRRSSKMSRSSSTSPKTPGAALDSKP